MLSVGSQTSGRREGGRAAQQGRRFSAALGAPGAATVGKDGSLVRAALALGDRSPSKPRGREENRSEMAAPLRVQGPTRIHRLEIIK